MSNKIPKVPLIPYPIDHDVPFNDTPVRYPLADMEVGDSFFIPESDYTTYDAVKANVHGAKCRRFKHYRILVRRVGVDKMTRKATEKGIGVRVWRTF